MKKQNYILVIPTWPMVNKVRKARPEWCCFVHAQDEKGLNILKNQSRIKRQIEKLQFIGIEVCIKIQPSLRQIKAAYQVGADAVLFSKIDLAKIKTARSYAQKLGLDIHQ